MAWASPEIYDRVYGAILRAAGMVELIKRARWARDRGGAAKELEKRLGIPVYWGGHHCSGAETVALVINTDTRSNTVAWLDICIGGKLEARVDIYG